MVIYYVRHINGFGRKVPSGYFIAVPWEGDGNGGKMTVSAVLERRRVGMLFKWSIG